MPRYSQTSADRLATCHEDLQTVFNTVIEGFDCSILCGHRNKSAQRQAFNDGFSKVDWPASKHNKKPSRAVDAAPYPIDWQDWERFHLFAGYVLGVAKMLYDQGKIHHRIRWGGDWDSDTKTVDEKFRDLPHFELGAARPATGQLV